MTPYKLHLGITLGVGALVSVCAVLLTAGGAERAAALWGAGVSTVVGVLMVSLKSLPLARGTGALKDALARQVLALMVRLGVVGAGAVVLHRDFSAAMAFVVAFFIAYLGQQVVEVRSLLTARGRADKHEVAS